MPVSSLARVVAAERLDPANRLLTGKDERHTKMQVRDVLDRETPLLCGWTREPTQASKVTARSIDNSAPRAQIKVQHCLYGRLTRKSYSTMYTVSL